MSADAVDQTLENYRRSILGEQPEAAVPKAQTFDDLARDAHAAERAERLAAKSSQPSMADFARQEREKLRPRLQRTELILDHAAQVGGYGIDQRRSRT